MRAAMIARLMLLGGAAWTLPTLAGDSLFGTVRRVSRPDLVVFESGRATYNVRIAGIIAPHDPDLAEEAVALVSRLVLGKDARILIQRRGDNGELVARVLTADSAVGMGRDVGQELVRAGLARRQRNFDYKYGQLSAAQDSAYEKRVGLWAARREQ